MSFNRVIISGRLTQDPEIKSTNTGILVANFSLAVNDWVKNEEYTSFINCIAFGKIAERLQQYTKKGLMVGVEGNLRQSRWEDSNGSKRSRIEVITSRLEIFEWKDKSNSSSQNNNYSEQNNYSEGNSHLGDFVEDEPDIPF